MMREMNSRRLKDHVHPYKRHITVLKKLNDEFCKGNYWPGCIIRLLQILKKDSPFSSRLQEILFSSSQHHPFPPK
jgi:hypothetical protein